MRYKSSSVTTRKFRTSFCPAMNQMTTPTMGRAMSATSQVSRSTPAMLVRHWYMAMMVTAQIAAKSRRYSAWKAMRCSKSEVRSVWLVIGVLGCRAESLGRSLRGSFFLARSLFFFGSRRRVLSIPPANDACDIFGILLVYSRSVLCDFLRNMLGERNSESLFFGHKMIVTDKRPTKALAFSCAI